jgi:hypothetical protein
VCIKGYPHCALRFIYDFLMAKVCLFVIYYYNTSLNLYYFKQYLRITGSNAEGKPHIAVTPSIKEGYVENDNSSFGSGELDGSLFGRYGRNSLT